MKPREVERRLAAHPASLAAARRLLDELRAEVPDDVLSEAALVLDECIARGIQESGLGIQHSLSLRLLAARGVLRGEIRAPRLRLQTGPVSPEDLGLRIVEKLASRWGADHGYVWFELQYREAAGQRAQ